MNMKKITHILVGNVGVKFTEWQTALSIYVRYLDNKDKLQESISEANKVKAEIENTVDTTKSTFGTSSYDSYDSDHNDGSVSFAFLSYVNTYNSVIEEEAKKYNVDSYSTLSESMSTVNSFLAGAMTDDDSLSAQQKAFVIQTYLPSDDTDNYTQAYQETINMLKESYDSKYNDFIISINSFKDSYASISGDTSFDVLGGLVIRAAKNCVKANYYLKMINDNILRAGFLMENINASVTQYGGQAEKLRQEFKNICGSYFEITSDTAEESLNAIDASIDLVKRMNKEIVAEDKDIRNDLKNNQNTPWMSDDDDDTEEVWEDNKNYLDGEDGEEETPSEEIPETPGEGGNGEGGNGEGENAGEGGNGEGGNGEGGNGEGGNGEGGNGEGGNGEGGNGNDKTPVE